MEPRGARSPEELETLLEDAFVLRDPTALVALFDPLAVLTVHDGPPEARGRAEIAQAVAGMWARERTYLAGARGVVQARDTALLVGDGAVHVVRRGRDRSWRYAISLLGSQSPGQSRQTVASGHRIAHPKETDMITTARVAPDTHTLSTSWPGPNGVVLPINAYCMLGAQPTLIDTGLSPLTEDFRATLWNIVDPADLRWIIVTHDDRDHTGSLMTILDEAPNATLVTNFISMVKMSEDWQLPMDRLRLINSGEQLDVGDDVFETFRPPAYDSPGTLAFHALRRNVCFSSDCFGAFLPAIAETAEDLPAAEYHTGVAMFTSAISPWLHDTTPARWQAGLDALRQRKPNMLLSTHGLPISTGLPALLDATASLPTGPAFAPPGQEFVESMLAMAGPHS